MKRSCIILALIMVIASSAYVYADPNITYVKDDVDFKKGGVSINFNSGVSRTFWKAHKVFIYKKAENKRKYKKAGWYMKKVRSEKVRSVDSKEGFLFVPPIRDTKAKGLVKYKVKLYDKRNRYMHKSFVFPILALQPKGKFTTRKVKKGTVVSLKLKNTSKKYKVKIKWTKKAFFSMLDEYEYGLEHELDTDNMVRHMYLTNGKGTKYLKQVVLKKNRITKVNIMIPKKCYMGWITDMNAVFPKKKYPDYIKASSISGIDFNYVKAGKELFRSEIFRDDDNARLNIVVENKKSLI